MKLQQHNLSSSKQARNIIAYHDIDKQAESPLVYTLRYALVYIICIIVMRVLAGGGNLCCNCGSRSQCIQRNNTLEVKTPSLIVLIIMPLTYIYKSLLHYK